VDLDRGRGLLHNGPMTGRQLRVRRLGIDTLQEAVVYMREDCEVCRSEGFAAQARVQVAQDGRAIVATLNTVRDTLLAPGEAGLSEAAWARLGAAEGSLVSITHPPPLDSLSHVRAKAFGRRLDATAMQAIVRDVVAGRYADIHLASFITACAAAGLDRGEMVALTRAMIDSGQRLTWSTVPVLDKHSVGGVPGNRTTMLVVPIVTAHGFLMPKTSSRSITSPAGTADTMETLAPVALDLPTMRAAVEREGGCIVWGGALGLSPADDLLIRVERPLELDAEGQLVASVLSKKAAAGATDVLIDLPVGETAKIRSPESAAWLAAHLEAVGAAVGLRVRTIVTDGTQPVGRGIGPALEARDVLAVLRGEPEAPADLRERAVLLAGRVLEMADGVADGGGAALAEAALADGRAWRKFQAICAAQGGMREPPAASHRHEVAAARTGRVARIDNRRLARAAKLAGAPTDPAAGLELHARVGDRVDAGAPLFTLHAQSPGELAYALSFVAARPNIVLVEDDA
jgi:thymidine phosphorylase